MKNKIIERVSLWDYLKNQPKRIVLYGMGNGAEKIIKVLSDYGISIAGIFASDEFARGNLFCGYKVEKLSDIEKKYDDFIILLCFGAGYKSLIDRIRELAGRYELYAPDVPLFGGELFTYEHFLDNYRKAQTVWDMLCDEQSKKVFCDIINYKISGKIEYLFDCQTDRKEIFSVLNPTGNDIYVDAGAYNGDTALEIAEAAGGRLKKIIALEPDKRNYKKLCRNTEKMDFIECVNAGAWNEDTTVAFSQTSGRNASVSESGKPAEMRRIDSLTLSADIIKYDVEGAEYEAITGSIENIRANKPRLEVALYHRTDDIFDLPIYINSINQNYLFYMRHHPYIPAWETNLYAK